MSKSKDYHQKEDVDTFLPIFFLPHMRRRKRGGKNCENGSRRTEKRTNEGLSLSKWWFQGGRGRTRKGVHSMPSSSSARGSRDHSLRPARKEEGKKADIGGRGRTDDGEIPFP